MRAITINPETKSITTTEIDGIPDILKIVGVKTTNDLELYQIDKRIAVAWGVKSKGPGFNFMCDDFTMRGPAVMIGYNRGEVVKLHENLRNVKMIVEFK